MTLLMMMLIPPTSGFTLSGITTEGHWAQPQWSAVRILSNSPALQCPPSNHSTERERKMNPKLRPTHQHKQSPQLVITAWVNDPKAGIPIWVVRKYHRCGGEPGQLTPVTGRPAQVGDYICHHDDGESDHYFSLSPSEFELNYEPIPPNEK
jgi:hypothetical protein